MQFGSAPGGNICSFSCQFPEICLLVTKLSCVPLIADPAASGQSATGKAKKIGIKIAMRHGVCENAKFDVALPLILRGLCWRVTHVTYSSDSEETARLLDLVADGSSSALEDLLRLYRPYLERLISLRMSPELTPRVGASDIVQETQVAVANRINDFLVRRPTSFRIWIRRKALERLVDQQRRHIHAEKRSVRAERRLADSSLAIARKLLTDTPSKILKTKELQQQVREVIDGLPELDREILTLRHAEGLSNAEAADLLEMNLNSARQRYGRALRRLHQHLAANGITLDGDAK